MTALQPAHVEYYGYSLQGGTRLLAEENLEFFTGPGNAAFDRVFGIVNGTPSFARIDMAIKAQYFPTKNVVVACCSRQGYAPTGPFHWCGD